MVDMVAMKAAFDSVTKPEERTGVVFGTLLAQLVTQGLITEEERTEIMNLFKVKK